MWVWASAIRAQEGPVALWEAAPSHRDAEIGPAWGSAGACRNS